MDILVHEANYQIWNSIDTYSIVIFVSRRSAVPRVHIPILMGTWPANLRNDFVIDQSMFFLTRLYCDIRSKNI
jgi:hypothetical protein